LLHNIHQQTVATLPYGKQIMTLNILQTIKSCLAACLLLFILLGCNTSDDVSEDGYIQLYNLSKDSPAIYLTVDEDFTEDSDDDDHYEKTYASIAYGEAQSIISLESKGYNYQLAWQDSDSSATEDLSILYEGEVNISEDTIEMIVLSDSILSPQVLTYSIPVINDEDDTENELFNLSMLNMHSNQQAVDVYLSTSEQDFSAAVLIGPLGYQQLSDNQKYAQGDYVFYVTLAGSDEILFRSHDVPFDYSSQYIMVLKENLGAGTSAYVLDRVSSSTITEYVDAEAEAQFRVYNAVAEHIQLNSYQEAFSLHINGVSDTPAVTALPYGEISNALILTSGDYSLDLTATEENIPLLSNHLLSIIENSNKTVFFYAEQEYVDNDNDGNIDENGDGIIDEIAINIFSLMVENSALTSIYEHELEIVNLIQSDEFSHVEVFFVRQDETITTAANKREIHYKNTRDISLKNNSYQVFVVAEDNGSAIILNSFELNLDEQSTAQFLVLESSDKSPTGYKSTLFSQVPSQE